jgi:hypothetical protein
MPPASRRTTICQTLTWGRKNIARFRQLLSVLVSWNVTEAAALAKAPVFDPVLSAGIRLSFGKPKEQT